MYCFVFFFSLSVFLCLWKMLKGKEALRCLRKEIQTRNFDNTNWETWFIYFFSFFQKWKIKMKIWPPQQCLKLERWRQGLPHINKVKLCCPWRSVCLFSHENKESLFVCLSNSMKIVLFWLIFLPVKRHSFTFKKVKVHTNRSSSLPRQTLLLKRLVSSLAL